MKDEQEKDGKLLAEAGAFCLLECIYGIKVFKEIKEVKVIEERKGTKDIRFLDTRHRIIRHKTQDRNVQESILEKALRRLRRLRTIRR